MRLVGGFASVALVALVAAGCSLHCASFLPPSICPGSLINDGLPTIRPGLSDITQVMVLLSTHASTTIQMPIVNLFPTQCPTSYSPYVSQIQISIINMFPTSPFNFSALFGKMLHTLQTPRHVVGFITFYKVSNQPKPIPLKSPPLFDVLCLKNLVQDQLDNLN